MNYCTYFSFALEINHNSDVPQIGCHGGVVKVATMVDGTILSLSNNTCTKPKTIRHMH